MKEKLAMGVLLGALSGFAFAAGTTGGMGEDPGAGTGAGPGIGMGEQPGVGDVGQSTAERFQSLDVDGSGYISRDNAEALSQLNEQFDQYDRDGDGQLDQAEFAQFEQDHPDIWEETPGAIPDTSPGVPGDQPGMGEPAPGGGM